MASGTVTGVVVGVVGAVLVLIVVAVIIAVAVILKKRKQTRFVHLLYVHIIWKQTARTVMRIVTCTVS